MAIDRCSAVIVRMFAVIAITVGLWVPPVSVHAAAVSERFAVPRGTLVRWGGIVERVDRRQSQPVVEIRRSSIALSRDRTRTIRRCSFWVRWRWSGRC